MKKVILVLVVVMTLASLIGCASKPAEMTAPLTVATYPPQILEHPGTAWGTNPPQWILEYVSKGYKAVERMPDYEGQFVVIVNEEGESRDGASLAAARMNSQTRISAFMETRVRDTFAGAQVGDKDMIETYMERVVKSVSEASFNGFLMEDETWAYMQEFTTEGEPDRRVYRVYQLWTINKEALERQLQEILDGAEALEPKTPEKERAIEAVQNAFYEGF
ncbi:MAG: hypothetical protein KKC64_11955 [Spirochaetes bacterium]|nr:hypothetical protein [Spirochaetota bacterium]